MVHTFLGPVSNISADGANHISSIKTRKGSNSQAPASPIQFLSGATCHSASNKACKKWVCCDRCSSWHHSTCAKLDSNDFDTLQRVKSQNIKWFCQNCNDGKDDTDTKMNTLMKIVETLQSQNQMILKILQNQEGSLKTEVKNQVEEYNNEERERDSRKCNLLLFNVPETHNSDGTENEA